MMWSRTVKGCELRNSPPNSGGEYLLPVLLLLLLCLTSCRQYMADQPRYTTYQESGLFPDGTSARPLPEGVIPQGFQQPPATFPFPITIDVLKHGQERYNIFCTPCHDHMGTGAGMV